MAEYRGGVQALVEVPVDLVAEGTFQGESVTVVLEYGADLVAGTTYRGSAIAENENAIGLDAAGATYSAEVDALVEVPIDLVAGTTYQGSASPEGVDLALDAAGASYFGGREAIVEVVEDIVFPATYQAQAIAEGAAGENISLDPAATTYQGQAIATGSTQLDAAQATYRGQASGFLTGGGQNTAPGRRGKKKTKTRLSHAEVWSDIQGGSGEREALIVEADITVLEELNGDHRASLVIDADDQAAASLAERKVVRIVYSDGWYEEYRIASIDSAVGTSRAIQVEGEGILLDLNGPEKIQRVEVTGLTQPDFTLLNYTAVQLIDEYILPACPGYVQRGVIESDVPIDQFTFDFDTPLGALRRIAELTNTELTLRREPDGVVYYVDMLDQIGQGANIPLAYLGKNLTRFAKKADARGMVNRVYGKGGGEAGNRLTLGANAWVVESASPSTITLRGIPVWEDGCLDGLWVGTEQATQLQQITGSAAPNVVTIANPLLYNNGSRVRVYADAAAGEVTYLEDQASVATYGSVPGDLNASDLLPADNLLANPTLDTPLSSSTPGNWNKVGIVFSAFEQDTQHTMVGEASVRVVASGPDQGIESDPVTLNPNAWNPYFSALVTVKVVSGAVRLELANASGVYPPADTKAWTKTTGQWVDLSVNGILLDSGPATVRVVSDGGGAEFYVDAAMLTNQADAPFFVAQPTANELWRRCSLELLRKRVPDISYAVTLADLYTLDPDSFPFDEITLGGEVRVIEETTGTDQLLRAVKIVRDVSEGGRAVVDLASRVPQLTDKELEQRIRGRRDPQEARGPAFEMADAAIEPATGDLIFQYRLNAPYGRSIRYLTSPTSQPTRDAVVSGGTVLNADEDDIVAGAGIASAPGSDGFITAVAFSGESGLGQDGASVQLRAINGASSAVDPTPSGSVSLRARQGGTLEGTISANASTERVYYEINEDPATEEAFPSVDVSDQFTDGPFPETLELLDNASSIISLGNRQLVHGTFRFWSSTEGFGDEVRVPLQVEGIGPDVIDIQAFYSGAGQVSLKFLTVNATSVRLAWSTTGPPNATDIDNGALVFPIDGQAEYITPVLRGVGETIYVGARARYSLGQLVDETGPDRKQEFKREAFVSPTGQADWTRVSSSLASLELRLRDAGLRITGVEFNVREGSETGDVFSGWSSGWTFAVGTAGGSQTLTRSLNVTVSEGQETIVRWRASYLDDQGNTREIGGTVSSANIDQVERGLIIPGTALNSQPGRPTINYVPIRYDQEGWSSTNELGTSEGYAAVPLPVGVRIVGFRARVYVASASDYVLCRLWRGDGSGSTIALSASLDTPGFGTGWITLSDFTISNIVTASDVYTAVVTMDSDSNIVGARCAYVEILYDRTSVQDTY